jgi:hypothetical protein
VAVFRTTAVESEMRLPFAGLHELLLPFLDRIDRLPTVQRNALEMALGLAPREAVPDIFLIGLATLALVADVAAEAPLLFVVEDAQWIDRSSGMVLGFVARRLEMEPVLMWFAVRAGVMSDVGRAGLPEFDLQSLGEEASARLLDAQAPDLSADLKRRILDEALGNPLALIELPVAAKDAAFETRPALPGSLPLTARLERAFAARLAELDADARALLLVAALEDGEPGGSVITAAGTDDRVAGLVYIAALAPDEDETTQSQLEKFPASDVLKFVEPADGRLWLNREGVSASPAISRPRRRVSCGRLSSRRRPTCSAGTHPASPGRRSRAGTSSPPRTGPCSPTSSGSWRSA